MASSEKLRSNLCRSTGLRWRICKANALGITHFIRIPLLNRFSSSQIQETLWRVASDPVSAAVPPLAYRILQRLSIGVVSLRLHTQKRRSRATALLRDLGDQDWRKLFSKAEAIRSKDRKSSTVSPERPSNQNVDQSGPQPLIVSEVFEAISLLSAPCLSLSLCSGSEVFVMVSNMFYKTNLWPQKSHTKSVMCSWT